jgi:hypothetical protein
MIKYFKSLLRQIKEFNSTPILIKYPSEKPDRCFCKIILRGRDYYFSFQEYDRIRFAFETQDRVYVKTQENKLFKYSKKEFDRTEHRQTNMFMVRVDRQRGFYFNTPISDDKGIVR